MAASKRDGDTRDHADQDEQRRIAEEVFRPWWHSVLIVNENDWARRLVDVEVALARAGYRSVEEIAAGGFDLLRDRLLEFAAGNAAKIHEAAQRSVPDAPAAPAQLDASGVNNDRAETGPGDADVGGAGQSPRRPDPGVRYGA